MADLNDLLAENPHPCIHPSCTNTVPYDDEPWCLNHSPDEGSFVPGYSYIAEQANLDKEDK